ncbi:hypothetical protein CRUP_001088 [Coryphaenoides rupestris]|nr:hypothetical protein CRUP_001088 [Coryphaenoides rupestris]
MASGLSCVSSLQEEVQPCFVEPHYRESYRLAIYALLCGGPDAYQEFLQAERINHLLSDQEVLYVLENAELPVCEDSKEKEQQEQQEEEQEEGGNPSTYFPTESDEQVPDLDLGWPEVSGSSETNISLLFHPPRQNTPTIKEVVRKQVQEAKQAPLTWEDVSVLAQQKLIAISMDVFTDVDIFQEVVSASRRGVIVYVLLDHAHFRAFLTMAQRLQVPIRDLPAPLTWEDVSVLAQQKVSSINSKVTVSSTCAPVRGRGAARLDFNSFEPSTAVAVFSLSSLGSERLGNLRVRTVSGPQYQCQSGAKFSGALEQRFILVDCKTVLYGTYSYTWSFEKINLSMVLVVTGQLVGSYDEEFRRLYARSVAPKELTVTTSPEEDCLKLLFSPSPSLLSLLQRPHRTNGLMTRGISVQERLHQSHRLDSGTLVRGHSYAGELQRLNSSSTRLRALERNGMAPREDKAPTAPAPAPPPARMSQLLSRHRMRYGSDQNLIPFNSETSLNRWKIDSYFRHDDDETPEAAYDVASPQGSQMGLNESQNQMFSSKAHQMKSRLEEIRMKRLSLQEYSRQSQENLRPMFSTQERSRMRSSLRTLDKSQSMAALVEHGQQEYSDQEPVHYENTEYFSPRLKPPEETPELEECPEMEEPQVPDAQQSAAQRERQNADMQTQDRLQPLPRTLPAAAKPGVKQKEPSVKPLGQRPSGGNIQPSRAMDPLLDIPEEKDAANKVDSTAQSCAAEPSKLTKVTGSPADKETNTTTPRGGRRALSKVDSIRSVGSRHQDLTKGSTAATRKDPPGARPRVTHAEPPPNREETPPPAATSSISNASTPQNSEKVQSPQGEQPFQRKNSLRSKVYSLLSLDERKSQRKEDKTLQRKPSMRSQNSSAASQQVSAESLEGAPPTAAVGQTTAELAPHKGTLKSVSRSQNAIDSLVEKERPSSAVQLDPELPQRSSRPKTSISGSRLTLQSEGAAYPQAQRERAYRRFEHLVSQDRHPVEKPVRSSSMRYLGKDRNSVLNSIRQQSAGTPKNYLAYQAPTTQDNRLGRFMQRVGNLITKNK